MKELRRQLRIQTHQVDQIKEELAFKDALVTKVNLSRVNIEKEMDTVKARHISICNKLYRSSRFEFSGNDPV